jgi:hypothetical protein
MTAMAPARSARPLLLLAAVAAAAALLGAAAGLEALLFVAPALLLAAPLLHGRFPGERRIAALASARAVARPRAARTLAPARRAPHALVARGGRLLAAALAVRPPPAASARA